jgi:hypothetical protein
VKREAQARSAQISAEALVHTSISQARAWFIELEAHPERYAFETHAGFRFTQGGFGQVGARFETSERFLGLQIRLSFELAAISEQDFSFRLRRPPLPVWGLFSIVPVVAETVRLSLHVGGTTPLGRWILANPLLKSAVRRQIGGEVQNIKQSMETEYTKAQSGPTSQATSTV